MRMIYVAYIAALVCLGGTLYRLGRWFVLPIGPESCETAPIRRWAAAFRAGVKMMARPRCWLIILHAFLTDVAAQRQILRQSPLRWATHMALCFGILILLLMHTFDDYTVAELFADYASTLNPFMFLRNLTGLFVLVGVIIALVRRRRDPVIRGITHAGDRMLIGLIAAIIVSGAALEAAQIVSPTIFDQMVADYMGSDDPEEIVPLKTYWAEHFDVVFTPPPAKDKDLLAQGEGLHADFCAACHSRPTSAVLAYPLAKAVKPLAVSLPDFELERWLWYAHYMISCLALALLPFSKLFHLLVTPISLITRALGPAGSNAAVNRPTRRAMGLDACTHCGECSRHCSVGPIFQVIPNTVILPSEKLFATACLAADRTTPGSAAELAEGSFICTECGRCTQWCPSGIDLQDLWRASKADLQRRGFPDLHGRMRLQAALELTEIPSDPGQAPQSSVSPPPVRLTDTPDTFRACVQCSICTSVCPVVAVSPEIRGGIGETPQQVMNLLRLQLKDAATAARMVWDCVTCYKCQEHCPQGVRVADVLYELRNEACRRLARGKERPPASPRPATADGKSGE